MVILFLTTSNMSTKNLVMVQWIMSCNFDFFCWAAMPNWYLVVVLLYYLNLLFLIVLHYYHYYRKFSGIFFLFIYIAFHTGALICSCCVWVNQWWPELYLLWTSNSLSSTRCHCRSATSVWSQEHHLPKTGAPSHHLLLNAVCRLLLALALWYRW